MKQIIIIEIITGSKIAILRFEYNKQKIQIKIPSSSLKFKNRIIKRMLKSHFDINSYD